LITTLYLISNLTWYHFKDFNGDYQIDACLGTKAHIQKNFKVKGVCLSEWDDILILDNKVYFNGKKRSQTYQGRSHRIQQT
jgi:hypothetical protein